MSLFLKELGNNLCGSNNKPVVKIIDYFDSMWKWTDVIMVCDNLKLHGRSGNQPSRWLYIFDSTDDYF